MKKTKRIFILLMCLIVFQGLMGNLGMVKTVKAATVKNGLVKSGSNYYYYSKGIKTKNKWVKVNVGKDSAGKSVYKKMYFGSNGAAYKANSTQGLFVTKTVDGKKYGFSPKGYLMPKGLYVGKKSEQFYYFNSDGTVNTSVSKAFNKAAVYGKSYSSLSALLKKYKITVKKTSKSSTCYPDPAYTGGKDYIYTFANFKINTCKDKKGKNEIFFYAESK